METGKTALYGQHLAAKAKMISFAGWHLPAFYGSVLEEHRAVRERAGIFDVSHMGEIFFSGSPAQEFLQYLTINDVSRLSPGQGHYSALCNQEGGVIDDLILYQLEAERYLMCVNASNISSDYAWIVKQAQRFPGVVVDNASHQWSQLAIQGPTSLSALLSIVPSDRQAPVQDLEYTQIMPLMIKDRLCYLARTGYTGEKGYELYLPHELASWAWEEIVASSPLTGIRPIGLGARDTLRLEAGYLLYGNDLNESTSPLEAGIGWATKLAAGAFIGREALLRQKAEGVERRIFCFRMEEQGIPRHDMEVYRGDEVLGTVTSGSVLPTLGGAGGMALLKAGTIAVGDSIAIKIRHEMKQARLVARPLYMARVKD